MLSLYQTNITKKSSKRKKDMATEDKKEKSEPFVATIRINYGQGLKVASRKLEKHLRNMKVKPIRIRLK